MGLVTDRIMKNKNQIFAKPQQFATPLDTAQVIDATERWVESYTAALQAKRDAKVAKASTDMGKFLADITGGVTDLRFFTERPAHKKTGKPVDTISEIASMSTPFIFVSYGMPVAKLRRTHLHGAFSNKPWLAALEVREGYEGWFLGLKTWVTTDMGKISHGDKYAELRQGLVCALKVSKVNLVQGAEAWWSNGSPN